MKRVLLIEDDRDIVELVRYNLEREGFQVASATDGAIGLAQVRKTPPDILLLDLMLPKLSGLEICKEIRRDQSLNRLPILMLTARGEEADRVVGLEMGADDYVTKPFSPRELGARVKALLRRTEPAGESPRVIEARGLTIDPSSYRVTHDGHPVTLSTLEFRLLYYLATRPNRVFTRDQLLDAVWGTERFVTPRSVDVYIRRLREKVETDADHPSFLKTVRGAGYMFESVAQMREAGVNPRVRVSPFRRLGLIYLALVAAILIAVEVAAPGTLARIFPALLVILLVAGILSVIFLRSIASRIRRLKAIRGPRRRRRFHSS